MFISSAATSTCTVLQQTEENSNVHDAKPVHIIQRKQVHARYLASFITRLSQSLLMYM